VEYKEPMELKITGDKLVDFMMHAATREDIAASKKELKEDIAAVRTELKEEIAAVKTELKEEIAAVKTELKEDIAAVKTELKEEILQVNHKISNLELTTAKLDTKIERYRYDSLKFTIWTGVGVVAALGSMMAKGFHWF
jgi:DNA-binding protein H-NS